MRKVNVSICGKEVEMPVSFDAGQTLEAVGYDPLRTALRSKKIAAGDYPLTAHGVVKVIHAGCQAAKADLTLQEIGQAIYDAGVMAYLGIAIDYLAAFVNAEPEHPIPKAGGAKEKKH